MWSEEQIAEFKEAFALFDKDGDGTITLDELRTVMQSLGQNPTENDLLDMIKEVDDDGNNEIDFNEFLFLMARNMQDIGEDVELSQGFKVFDVDGDGQISIEDLKAFMESIGEQFTEEELQDIMAEIDPIGDGLVNFQEFSRLISNKQ